MEIVLAIILTTAIATFVAWPFFTREALAPPPEAQLSPLERQKFEAYSAIKEAEFDYQMGKLTDTDFGMLRERYSRQALSAIAAIEAAHARGPAGSGKPGKGAEAHKPGRVAYCPACGRGVPARGNFCAGCGQAIKALKEAVA